MASVGGRKALWPSIQGLSAGIVKIYGSKVGRAAVLVDIME